VCRVEVIRREARNGRRTMFGRNLEAACRANQATKARRLEVLADNLAAQAAALPAGSPEWMKVAKEFAEVVMAANANNTPITK